MYEEKKIRDAIRYLSAMLLSDCSQEEVEQELGALDMECIVQSVRSNAQMVHVYKAGGEYERAFFYYGSELFDMRATKLLESLNCMSADIVMTSYVYELWLLEDMTPAVVSCMRLTVPWENGNYITEYRTFKGILDEDSAMNFSPDDLTAQLMELSEPQMDNEAPVYEL